MGTILYLAALLAFSLVVLLALLAYRNITAARAYTVLSQKAPVNLAAGKLVALLKGTDLAPVVAQNPHLAQALREYEAALVQERAALAHLK